MTTNYARGLRKNLQEAFQNASQNLQRSHEVVKDKSQHYPRYRPYKVGNFVYVLTPKVVVANWEKSGAAHRESSFFHSQVAFGQCGRLFFLLKGKTLK